MNDNHHLKKLYEVTQAITAPLDLNTVLDSIVRSACTLLDADAAAILFSSDDEETAFDAVHAHNMTGSEAEAILKSMDVVLGERSSRQQLVVANDLLSNSAFVPPMGAGSRLTSYVSVPMRLGDRLIGNLDVHILDREKSFGDEDVFLLEMVAGQAAISIQNAQLYQELREAHDELDQRVALRTAELQGQMDIRRRAEEKLEREQWVLRTVIDSLPDPIYLKDREARFLNGNKALCSLMGVKGPDDLVGRTDFDFFPRELAEGYFKDDMAVISSGKPLINREEPVMDLRTGQKRWLVTSKVPFLDANGRSLGLVGTGRDITKRMRALEALERNNADLTALNEMGKRLQLCSSEEETYVVIRDISEGLFPHGGGCLRLYDAEKNTLNTSYSWGVIQECAGGRDALKCNAFLDRRMSVGSDDKELSRCKEAKSDKDFLRLCAPLRIRDKVLGVLHLSLNEEKGVVDELTRSKRVIIRRMAEYYALYLANLRLRESLHQEAIHDQLTGLYNRRYMEASLGREAMRIRRQNSVLGMIMLDIDHFKKVNDTLGHEGGDVVLASLGKFLRQHVRGDDIACRYGGEEFMVLMPTPHPESVVARANELWSGIGALKILYENELIPITVSAGVAFFRPEDTDVGDAVNNADKAMYEAKAQGRNRVVVFGGKI